MARRKKERRGALARDKRIMAERYAAMMRGAEDFEGAVESGKKFLRYAKMRATESRAIDIAAMARGAYDTRDAAQSLLDYLRNPLIGSP